MNTVTSGWIRMRYRFGEARGNYASVDQQAMVIEFKSDWAVKALESARPVHRHMRRRRGLWRFLPQAQRLCREHAAIAGQVHSWRRHQRRQASHQRWHPYTGHCRRSETRQHAPDGRCGAGSPRLGRSILPGGFPKRGSAQRLQQTSSVVHIEARIHLAHLIDDRTRAHADLMSSRKHREMLSRLKSQTNMPNHRRSQCMSTASGCLNRWLHRHCYRSATGRSPSCRWHRM